MSKTIVKRRNNFTAISNDILLDKDITWKAKGLFSYMLSKPEGWAFNPKGDIVKRAKDNITSVYSAIKELIDNKYISRSRNKDGSVTYYLFENPKDNNIVDYLEPQSENLNQKTSIRKPDLENLNQKTSTHSNTEYSNTEYSNTEYSNTEYSKKDITPPSVKTEKNPPKDEKFNPKKELQELGIADDLIDDWLKIRKAKKMPLTQRALNLTIAEAEKAGFTLAEAIDCCAARGWAGFMAEYLKGPTAKQKQPMQTEKERRIADYYKSIRQPNPADNRNQQPDFIDAEFSQVGT